MWLVATTRTVQVRRGATSCSGHFLMGPSTGALGGGVQPEEAFRAQGHRLPLARSEGNIALLFLPDC